MAILLDRSRQGDDLAWEAIVRRFGPRAPKVGAFLLVVCASPFVAVELAVQAYATLHPSYEVLAFQRFVEIRKFEYESIHFYKERQIN